jgi:hypothetical protein
MTARRDCKRVVRWLRHISGTHRQLGWADFVTAACLLAGLRPMQCDEGSLFVEILHACVRHSDLDGSEFITAVTSDKVCAGGLFTTAASVKRLRFCNRIVGSIVLSNIEDEFDTSVFWHIRQISGSLLSAVDLHVQTVYALPGRVYMSARLLTEVRHQ